MLIIKLWKIVSKFWNDIEVLFIIILFLRKIITRAFSRKCKPKSLEEKLKDTHVFLKDAKVTDMPYRNRDDGIAAKAY